MVQEPEPSTILLAQASKGQLSGADSVDFAHSSSAGSTWDWTSAVPASVRV